MAKFITILILIFAFSLALTVNAFAEEPNKQAVNSSPVIQADEINYQDSPANKLGRGIGNTATCWAEIPQGMIDVSQKSDPFLGATLGFFQGTFTALVRGATGLYDTITFAIPPYDKPLMQPEYALQNADGKFKQYLW